MSHKNTVKESTLKNSFSRYDSRFYRISNPVLNIEKLKTILKMNGEERESSLMISFHISSKYRFVISLKEKKKSCTYKTKTLIFLLT